MVTQQQEPNRLFTVDSERTPIEVAMDGTRFVVCQGDQPIIETRSHGQSIPMGYRTAHGAYAAADRVMEAGIDGVRVVDIRQLTHNSS